MTTTDRHADVIVAGLGSMGSAAAHQLAARGLSVLGLERFWPAHDQGSGHGETRIVRQSYFEGPAYVPLLRRAYEGWHQLQEDSGRDLLTLCGGLYVGDPDSKIFAGAKRSAEAYGLAHEVLDADAIRARFPAMDPAEHALGLFEENAGFVRPEETILANLDLAARHGAELRYDEPVRSWRATPGGGVEVTTDQGTYGADRLVVAAGAWAPRLLTDLGLALRVERQVVCWFTPDFSTVSYEHWRDLPVYIEETDHNRDIYGFPMVDGPAGGLKLAFFNTFAQADPDAVDRTTTEVETEATRARARQLFPHLTGPLVKAMTCLYTTSPDRDFVVGPLPEHPQVVVASVCSGHGFKFVPVMGEILADLTIDGRTPHDITLFDPTRPSLRVPA
ncbi:N-methyl-L-tryptophan oxidase [Microlunatus flavus]|uniref:Sarcosine oxidase n=1 Tax=Microlunatus flavus TaxID=1036181 RepID=A0A1H9HBR4_9ACTN|nr:N-methyl-L-tryptophan oxidase [Microlunatus flavus]SEQ59785.1 sarcosine oxidase [Microlunatus flavus]